MPNNFLSQWKSARNLVLSANSQAAWQEVMADAYLTRRQRFDGGAVLELKSTRRSDEAYSGKGTAFATDGQVTSWDTTLSGFKAELDDFLCGWLFAFLMGKDTVTGAGPYTHTFTFDETTRTAVATNVYMEDTEAIHYKCPDMCVNDITLTINEIGTISAEMTMMGTGRQTIVAMASLPALSAYNYLLGSDCTLTMNGGSFLGRHMNTTLKLENQLTVHKAPGGGLYGIFVRKQNPKFSFSTTIAAKDTDDTYTLFENDTATDVVWAVNSGASAQLTVTIPVAHLKTTKLGFDKDMVVWQIEGDETTCYDVGGTPPISVQVVTAQAAYLAQE
jgi:hypothetical protein